MTDFDRSDELLDWYAEDTPDGAQVLDESAPTAEGEKPARRSVAAQLVDLARGAYLLGVTDTDDPFGLGTDLPHIAMMLRGGRAGLRAELSRRFFAETNTVPSQQALADACMVLEGFANQQPAQRVYLRVAESGLAVYIDMGDTVGRVIEIRAGRWKVEATAPVLFRRTKLTGVLPPPHTGDLSVLWQFVGVDEQDRPLVLAWLVAALVQVDVPHPILALLAEQGSAKSTVTRILVSLVDPSAVPLRQPPRDPDGWTTAASASWVVALDNLSGTVSDWLSDCLCRASTGDGSVKRALYTDHDVAVTSFRRCAIVNGVDLIVDRGDLAERVLGVGLPRVTTRRSEDELAAAWDTARPGVLGALLDLAAEVHHRLAAIEVTNLPRMADFAKVLAAVDEILGTTGLTRYRQRAQRAAADTLDAPLIAELVAARTPFSDATSAQLLAALTPQTQDWRKPRGWPRNARAVTGLLTRHAPALRAMGWEIDNDQGQNKDHITKWTVTPPEKDGIDNPPGPPNPSAQFNGHKSGESAENPLPAADPPGGLHAGQASYPETADPPQTGPLSSGNGSAGQAGHETRPSLVLCSCGEELTAAESLAAGMCTECRHDGRLRAVAAAKSRLDGAAS